MKSKYGDKPAFPKTGGFNENQSAEFDSRNQDGMTLREYYIGRAMQGLTSREALLEPEYVAMAAISLVDAVLNVLEGETI